MVLVLASHIFHHFYIWKNPLITQLSSESKKHPILSKYMSTICKWLIFLYGKKYIYIIIMRRLFWNEKVANYLILIFSMEMIGRFPTPEEVTKLELTDYVPVWLPADNISDVKDVMKNCIQQLRNSSLKLISITYYLHSFCFIRTRNQIILVGLSCS